MKKEEKDQIIDVLVNDLQSSNYIYLTDISNLNVEKTNELRRLCFKRNVKLRVVKNTLLKKAMEKSERDFSELFNVLHGSTSLMIGEPGNVPARLIKEFRRSSDRPILKGAYIEEMCFIGDDQLDNLVSIKSREELIGDIIGMLQSPAQNVISALQSSGNKLGGILKTLSEKE